MSKGLEAFDDLTCNYPKDYVNSYDIVLNYINALEIIKETCDIFFQEEKEYGLYRVVIKRKNSCIQNCGCAFETSKEDYNLLKEVLS